MKLLATAQPLRLRGIQKRWVFFTDKLDRMDKSIIAEPGYVTARALERRGSQWSTSLHAPFRLFTSTPKKHKGLRSCGKVAGSTPSRST